MTHEFPSQVSPDNGETVVRRRVAELDVTYIGEAELDLINRVNILREQATRDETARTIASLALNSMGRLDTKLSKSQRDQHVEALKSDVVRQVKTFVPNLPEAERLAIIQDAMSQLDTLQDARANEASTNIIAEQTDRIVALEAQVSRYQLIEQMMRTKYADNPEVLEDLAIFFGPEKPVPASTISGPLPTYTAEEVRSMTKFDTHEAVSPGHGIKLSERFKAVGSKTLDVVKQAFVPSDETLHAERVIDEVRTHFMHYR